MSYYFFLGPGLKLPIPPSELTIQTPSQNKTVTLINEGEVNILRKKGLKEISFEALLPQVKYPFASYDLGNYTATAGILALKALDAANVPFPFVVMRMTPNGKVLFFTSMLVTLEDYELYESAENGMDVVVKINLKEYNSYGTSLFKQVAMTALGALATGTAALVSKTRDSSTKTTNKTYTVKKGDTLWGIAKREFNDGQKYKDIAKLNNIANPNKIQVGQVLRLS